MPARVKIPGESDGECTRGLGPAGETIDPEWGLIDPAAGQWFPEMALDLVSYANPQTDVTNKMTAIDHQLGEHIRLTGYANPPLEP